MKKFLCLALCATMLLALAVGVGAQEITSSTGSGNVEIQASYTAKSDNKADIEAGAEGTKVYYLTLNWEQTGSISYNAGKTTYSWNQKTLSYDGQESGKGWSVGSDAKIVISAVNRSNRDMDIACGNPVAVSGVTISGKYDHNAFTVASAAINGFDGIGKEQSGSATYVISGVSGDGWDGEGGIGTITVTITGK